MRTDAIRKVLAATMLVGLASVAATVRAAEPTVRMAKILADDGIDLRVGAAPTAVRADGDSVAVSLPGPNGSEELVGSHLFLATGRTPNTDMLNLKSAGIRVNEQGYIPVNEKLETNVPNVYAVGDVNGKSLLAHAASRMGEVVVHNLTGRADRMRYDAIPYVVYTFPDVAAVGLTEEQAQERGYKTKSFKLPMGANGRHLGEHVRPVGFTKVVIDADTRVLLGVHMLGTYASELITTAVAMIEAELRVEDIRDIVFPHPTVSEVMREAMWMID